MNEQSIYFIQQFLILSFVVLVLSIVIGGVLVILIEELLPWVIGGIRKLFNLRRSL